MNSISFIRAAACVGAAFFGLVSAANADVGVSIGVHQPGFSGRVTFGDAGYPVYQQPVIYAPPPVVYYPQPAYYPEPYYAPAPVAYLPPPRVIYRPAYPAGYPVHGPGYARPVVFVRPGYGHHHHHGWARPYYRHGRY